MRVIRKVRGVNPLHANSLPLRQFVYIYCGLYEVISLFGQPLLCLLPYSVRLQAVKCHKSMIVMFVHAADQDPLEQSFSILTILSIFSCRMHCICFHTSNDIVQSHSISATMGSIFMQSCLRFQKCVPGKQLTTEPAGQACVTCSPQSLSQITVVALPQVTISWPSDASSYYFQFLRVPGQPTLKPQQVQQPDSDVRMECLSFGKRCQGHHAYLSCGL